MQALFTVGGARFQACSNRAESKLAGWIAISRDMTDHPLFKGRHDRIAAWVCILMAAAWKDTRQNVGGQVVEVRRGQLCASQAMLCDLTGLSRKALRTFLKDLETEGALGIRPATKGAKARAMLTICNYDEYQAVGPSKGQARAKEGPTKETREQGNNKKPTVSNIGQDDASFDAFWSVVPRKVAKGAARKAWAKAVKSCPPSQLIDGMKRYAQQRRGQDHQYTVHPATWLNQERWQDEAAPSAQDFHNQLDQHLQEAIHGLSGTNEPSRISGERLSKPLPAPDASGRSGGGAGDQGHSGGDQRGYLNLVKPRRFS